MRTLLLSGAFLALTAGVALAAQEPCACCAEMAQADSAMACCEDMAQGDACCCERMTSDADHGEHDSHDGHDGASDHGGHDAPADPAA